MGGHKFNSLSSVKRQRVATWRERASVEVIDVIDVFDPIVAFKGRGNGRGCVGQGRGRRRQIHGS